MNYFNYFTEIEETFIRRRGKHLLLSPLDWALIESWQEKGVPLKIVLRGIENVFDSIDKNPNRAQMIKSLTYCRDEVETQFQIWLETQVGKSRKPIKEKEEEPRVVSGTTLFSDETIRTHLENAAILIDQAKARAGGRLKEVLDKVSAELGEFRKTAPDAEKLEESLSELESLIDETLLGAADKKAFEKLSRRIESDLARNRSKMEPEVYQRTVDLMLLKGLREEAKIPRLSLFYL